MKRLLEAVDAYIKDCTWKDLFLVHVFLCAIGVLMGLMMPSRTKRSVAWVASMAMAASYVPLMGKFLPHLLGEKIAIADIYKK